MRHTILFLSFLLILSPAAARGQHGGDGQQANVNARYVVESVSITGIAESRIGTSLREDLQRLVGQNYDQDAAHDLAARMKAEFPDRTVRVVVRRGDQAEHVKVVFDVHRRRDDRFDVELPLVVYHSLQRWSGAIDLGFDTHHNYVSFGLLNTADELLERNAGYRLRYEHRRVGTDAVQVGVEFARYRQTFEPATLASLPTAPAVPGEYRRRQSFTPFVSVLPVPSVKLTVGLSLQNLDFDLPDPHDERAYAFTVDAQVRHRVRAGSFTHTVGADYGVRRATEALESQFVYTRHLVSGDYTFSTGRHVIGVHGKAGEISGAAPLFDRFSLGNSTTLRGWNKFDVAPLGGSRVAHGSLEYRYRPFQIFWDFGAVWDQGQTVTVRHGLGVGLAFRNGAFVSVAFPLRVDDVSPVVMFGFRR